MSVKVTINIPKTYAVGTEDARKFLAMVMREMLAMSRTIASEGEYSTGILAAHTQMDGPRIEGTRVRGTIYNSLNYALSVEKGAKRHDIFPKAAAHTYRFGTRKRPQLKFFWHRAGRIAYFPQIPGSPGTIGRSHPGIRHPKKFLSTPLLVVGVRHNLQVTTTDL
jgi:hypothetical protein